MIVVRPEEGSDRAEILELVGKAFQPRYPDEPSRVPVEVGLLRDLFECAEYLPAMSLAGDDGGLLVGHLICTRAWIGDAPSLGLGPLAVRPDRQGTGVGTVLMRALIDAARAEGETIN